MMCRGAEGYSGSLRCFNDVHILRVSFPHVSDVCIVLCSVKGTASFAIR
jgi:hypothetical protein